MLEPFIWMFKTKNFKQHVLYLLFTYVKFFIPAIVCFCASAFLCVSFQPIVGFVLTVLGFVLLIAPFLCVQGYFWELTGAIIDRDWDIKSASVYNGKVSSIYSVTLPEIDTKKFIWRGIASYVAIVIMFIPFLLIILSTSAVTLLNGDYTSTYSICYVLLFLFFFMFIPALLWNYANRNSILAVLNIRKAIYLIGNYTGRYFLNTILAFAFSFLVSFVGALVSIPMQNPASLNVLSILSIIIYCLITIPLSIYSIYVFSYLIGTIAPPAEK